MFGGILLCEGHAGQILAQERVYLLQGIVCCLDLQLSSVKIQDHPELARLLRVERTQTAAELDSAYDELLAATV